MRLGKAMVPHSFVTDECDESNGLASRGAASVKESKSSDGVRLSPSDSDDRYRKVVGLLAVDWAVERWWKRDAVTVLPHGDMTSHFSRDAKTLI